MMMIIRIRAPIPMYMPSSSVVVGVVAAPPLPRNTEDYALRLPPPWHALARIAPPLISERLLG